MLARIGPSSYLCTALRKQGIVSWCNGSTTVFGSVCRGSNPRETTHRRSFIRCRVDDLFV